MAKSNGNKSVNESVSGKGSIVDWSGHNVSYTVRAAFIDLINTLNQKNLKGDFKSTKVSIDPASGDVEVTVGILPVEEPKAESK